MTFPRFFFLPGTVISSVFLRGGTVPTACGRYVAANKRARLLELTREPDNEFTLLFSFNQGPTILKGEPRIIAF